jgi:farnesyl diphosphate synthase
MDIVTYKTAYYSFYLPVACGLHLAGITDDKAFSDAKAILIKMGQYFQIQDDYLDCFADPEVLGKIGTDIQDNKCSWLVCTALQHATAEQKEVIIQNYGQDDEKRIATIKTLFTCVTKFTILCMHQRSVVKACLLLRQRRVMYALHSAPLQQ